MKKNGSTQTTNLYKCNYEPPSNIKEMIKFKSLSQYITVETVTRESPFIQGNELIYLHNEKLGFDKLSFHAEFSHFEEDKLFQMVSEHEKSLNKFPKAEVILAKNEKSSVNIPFKTHKVNSLIIVLSPYATLSIKKNPLIGKNKYVINDEASLTLRVEPDSEYTALGNICNYSVTDLQNKLEDIKTELATNWGIHIKKLFFSNVELNVTFLMQHNFNDIAEALRFIFQYKEIDYLHVEQTNIEQFSYPRKTIHELKSPPATVVVKLYDKVYETNINPSKNQTQNYSKVEISPNECLVRLEFHISNQNIGTYFKGITSDSITEDNLNSIFNRLVNKYIQIPISNFFKYKSIQRKNLAKYIDSKIEPVKKISKRKKITSEELEKYNLLCQARLQEAINIINFIQKDSNNSPIIYGVLDLKYLIKQSKTLKSIASNSNLDITNEYFRFVNRENYQILFTFLDKLTNEKHRIKDVPIKVKFG